MLTVSTSPDFAAKWLVHRLGRFAEVHPEIDLRVSATMHHVDFASEDVDIAVRHGDGHWPGLHVTRLCSEHLFAVCSPALLLNSVDPLTCSSCRCHLEERAAWFAWLDAADVSGTDAIHGPILNRASMLIDAAVDGQGVAPLSALAAWDLINRRLVRPFPVALPLSKSYWIVSPKATASLPKLVAFREWLLAQANDDTRRLEVVVGSPARQRREAGRKITSPARARKRPVGQTDSAPKVMKPWRAVVRLSKQRKQTQADGSNQLG